MPKKAQNKGLLDEDTVHVAVEILERIVDDKVMPIVIFGVLHRTLGVQADACLPQIKVVAD